MPGDAPTVSMTLQEAYALHAWHLDQEATAAGKGDYSVAQGHKDRAAEIGRAFWPADAWERSWSAKP